MKLPLFHPAVPGVRVLPVLDGERFGLVEGTLFLVRGVIEGGGHFSSKGQQGLVEASAGCL